jgi:hypothetical protein
VDPRQFDAIARALGVGTNRRLLVGGLLGGLLSASPIADVVTKPDKLKSCKKKSDGTLCGPDAICQQQTCNPCPNGQKACHPDPASHSYVCTDITSSDSNNCGGCGIVCPDDQFCCPIGDPEHGVP